MYPEELIELDRWCIWRYVERDGKETKLPVNPLTGEFARSNDESTWASYEHALYAFKKGRGDGLGFFFKAPYIGIDLDNVEDDIFRYQNGDYENNIVHEFYETFKSYGEISPSGTGVHIIAKGKIPGERRRSGNVEMYSEGRFFTMTENSLHKYKRISEVDEQVFKPIYNKYLGTKNITRLPNQAHGLSGHDLSDLEVISRIHQSKQSMVFDRLLKGGWEEDYDSQSEADLAMANILAFWTARNYIQMDRIFRESSLMRDKWDEKRGKTTYGQATLNKAINEATNIYEPTKKQIFDYKFGGEFYQEETKKKEYPSRSYDDTGNAQRFLDRYGDIVRYSYNRKKFYVYNGTFWELDERGLVRTLIDQTIEDMKDEKVFASEEVDEEEAQKLLQKHIKNSRSNAAKNRIEDEIKHHIPVTFEEFNPDDTLLNTPNGYLDLTSGEQREEDKEKMFSYVTNSEMTENQRPDTWIDFLNDIFNHDQELIRFIQKAVGYSMTGSTREQVMFILHGKGRNGKSIFIETIREILGNYSDNIQAKTLMVKRGDTINNDIAKLQGVRLVTSSEPNEGFRFDEGLIKQLTGGDTVTARFLYGEEFNFDPKFKIWVTTNHKPLVRGTDDGIWRRLLLIPFKVQIPEEKVDKDLKYKLMREAPAILNWMVEGCVLWQKEGLGVPKEVLKASESYRQEMDVLEQFVADECEVGEGYEVAAKDLYNTYKKWADEAGEYKMGKNKFGEKMKDKFKHKKSSRIMYEGLRIKENYPGLSNFTSFN